MNQMNSAGGASFAVLYCDIPNYENLQASMDSSLFAMSVHLFLSLVAQIGQEFQGQPGPVRGVGRWVFFKKPEQALEAAQEIQGHLSRARQNNPAVSILQGGIVLSWGNLVESKLGNASFLKGPAMDDTRAIGGWMNDYPLDILATQAFLNALGTDAESWWVDQYQTDDGTVTPIFELFAHQDAPRRAWKRKWDLVLSQALRAYFSITMPQAEALFCELLEAGPHSTDVKGLMETYLCRCRDFLSGEDRSGVLDHLRLSGATERVKEP